MKKQTNNPKWLALTRCDHLIFSAHNLCTHQWSWSVNVQDNLFKWFIDYVKYADQSKIVNCNEHYRLKHHLSNDNHNFSINEIKWSILQHSHWFLSCMRKWVMDFVVRFFVCLLRSPTKWENKFAHWQQNVSKNSIRNDRSITRKLVWENKTKSNVLLFIELDLIQTAIIYL